MFCVKGREISVYANSMHEHEKSGGSGQNVERKNTIFQADEWKGIERNHLLQQRPGFLRKEGSMKGLYCK